MSQQKTLSRYRVKHVAVGADVIEAASGDEAKVAWAKKHFPAESQQPGWVERVKLECRVAELPRKA